MNVKPLIKVLNPFLLRAVSLFIASPTDLPQGLTEQKGFQPADRGKSWGLEQIWGRRGVNGRLGQPRPLQQRAGRSQTRHDKWLCPKTECKPKPTGSKKKISMGCIEESIYQEVSMKVSLLISNSLWISAWIHTFLYEHSYHTARRDTFRKEYFSPNNFLVWFFFLFACLMVLFFWKLYRGKSEWSWPVCSSCSFFMCYKIASEQIPFAECSPTCLDTVKNF